MTTPKQTKTKHLPLLWLAIAILLTGCTPVPPMFKANYTTDYQPDPHLPQRPDVVARLLGDTLVVSACVYTKTLKPDSSVAGGPAWRFNIEFNLIDKNFKPLPQSNTQIDQTTTLTTPWIPDTLWLHFKLKPRISSQSPVLLTIKLTDAVTNTTLENWTTLLPSNYPMLQTPGLIPITFCVKSGTPISAHRLQADIATHYTPTIPSPPFTSENRPPAPVLAWKRMPPAKQNPLKTPAPGLMRLTDSTSHQETLILVASKNFPAATTPQEGLLAIRYITTREEFRQLTTTSNLLQQILTVWDQPDQPDQAAKRARQYLDKIEEANRFFTRSQPGSLTDRGMIWIVYGVPGTVWKSPGIETWIYHETENGLPLRFDFDLTPIPTGREWILRRSDLFRPSWNKAVNQWRQ